MSSSASSRRLIPLIAGALFVATGALFSGTLGHDFVWDDEQFIVKNAFIATPGHLPKIFTSNTVAGAGIVSNFYRPLSSLTHWIDVRLWGLKPGPHHATTLLLHAAFAAVLFTLLTTLAPVWPSAIAAAWFAWHPLQVDLVAYICGRNDTLAMLFLCLGLLAFQRHLVLSLLCAACAVLSKESLALFPAFLFIYTRLRGWPFAWRRHAPFWALSAVYVALRLTVLNFKNTLNFYEQPNILTEQPLVRLATYFTTLPKAFQLWLWPTGLHHERSWPVFASFAHPMVWGSALLLAALLAWAWATRRRMPAGLAGLAWFLVATLPTSNLIVLINAIFYDHWFVLPGLGLAIFLSRALAAAFNGPGWMARLAAVWCGASLAALPLLTWDYARVWRNGTTLYEYILRWEPQSAKMHANLGMAYAGEGRAREAIEQYRRAIALDDSYPESHHNLGHLYVQLGQEANAVQEFTRAVELGPRFHHSWLYLGSIALRRNQLDRAEEAFLAARRAHPYAPEAYLGLARVAEARGNRQAARAYIDEGLKVLPNRQELLDYHEALR